MKLLSALSELLYPPKCAFCGELLPKGEREICSSCRKKLPYHRNGERKADFVPLIAAPLYYEGTVRESLHRYKFGGRTAAAVGYAELMSEEVIRLLDGKFDVLSYVPLHRKRKRERGYDQALLLAEELGKQIGMEPKTLLVKLRNAPPQSGTGDASARRANISGCYGVLPGAEIQGKRILLVDDILTTGATLSECARILKLNGAEEVCGAVVACSRD